MHPEPSTPGPGEVTRLLSEATDGSAEALDRLFPLVYDELRRIASQRLRRERPDHTLRSTALVHEAYLKLVDQDRVRWRNRSHFFAVASEAMRRILVNYAEARRAAKRGGGALHVSLEEEGIVLEEADLDELLAVDEALERLEEFNPRGARVVTYRFFGGLGHEEIADVLGLSTATVRRSWAAARSWLRRELTEGPALP